MMAIAWQHAFQQRLQVSTPFLRERLLFPVLATLTDAEGSTNGEYNDFGARKLFLLHQRIQSLAVTNTMLDDWLEHSAQQFSI